MPDYAWDQSDPSTSSPVEVAIVESFLNTIDEHTFGAHASKPDEERDLFRTPDDLSDWLRRQGLAASSVDVTERDLERARTLRTGLREWLRERQGLASDGSAVQHARVVCRDLAIHVDVDYQPTLKPAGDGVDAALASLVAHLPLASANGILDRLKMCAADDCRFVYYDHSRSRTSRWCSTDVCGNRIKTRRYRSRHG